MRRATPLLAGIAVCLLWTAAAAIDAPQPLAIDEAVGLIASAGGTADYPNANEIIVFTHTAVEYEHDGAYVQYDHELMKIITEQGVDDNGDMSFSYHRRYTTHDILLVRVIKADGTVVDVSDDMITDGTPPQVSAMNIFESDFREKTVVFPGLEVGDAIETITLETSAPLLENAYTGIFFMQYTGPILDASVSVTGPSDMPLVHAVKDGDVAFAETEKDGRTTYLWTATDTEQIEPEIGMAPFRQVATRVLVSSIQTWPELSRFGYELLGTKCVAEDSVKELTAEITAGLTTTEEKITAIHYWVMENVRYLGLAMDRGAFLEPHFAAYTLEKEYGICRDKAVLMVTMLGEIGVPAWVVMVNPSFKTDTEIPSVYFEHGIVAIEDGKGGYRYFDPTIEHHREIDASYVGDRWVLHLTPEGEDIRQTPHRPAAVNSGDIMETGVLDKTGGIQGAAVITGRGIYEMILRQIAATTNEEQMKQIWTESVQGIYPGAELTEFTMSDEVDLYQPMTINVGYRIGDYALDADPYTLFRIPSATGAFDFLSGLLVGRLTNLPERKYPLNIGTSLGLVEQGAIEVPEGYAVESLPDAVEYEEGPISLSIAYEFVPGSENGGVPVVKYSKVFGVDAFQLSPVEYRALKEASRLASRSMRGEVVLKREEG
jgi:transglutaminase-like putative cysteine protease